MKLEVGMYVRTKKGIAKIKKIFPNDSEPYFEAKYETDTYLEIYYDSEYVSEDNVLKASYNIIDVLEVGDILVDDANRKLEILLIDNELMVRNAGLIYDNNYYLPIKSIAIKSVITHEQMEQMAYKVGE